MSIFSIYRKHQINPYLRSRTRSLLQKHLSIFRNRFILIDDEIVDIKKGQYFQFLFKTQGPQMWPREFGSLVLTSIIKF